MTLKFLDRKCRRCGHDIQVRTNNEWMHCDICHTSNCKNPLAYQTDEDRFIDGLAKMDQIIHDSME